MSKFEKLLFDIMCGYKDQNILFQDLCKLLEALILPAAYGVTIIFSQEVTLLKF